MAEGKADIEIKVGDQLYHIVALTHNDKVVKWADLTSPKAWMRRKSLSRSSGVQIGIVDYPDEPGEYTCRLTSTVGQTESPGDYVIDIEATYLGVKKTFPSGRKKYITVYIEDDAGGT